MEHKGNILGKILTFVYLVSFVLNIFCFLCKDLVYKKLLGTRNSQHWLVVAGFYTQFDHIHIKNMAGGSDPRIK